MAKRLTEQSSVKLSLPLVSRLLSVEIEDDRVVDADHHERVRARGILLETQAEGSTT